jgi:hypothetical protein
MQGADVALLHTELRQLSLPIAEAEASAQSFGASTHAAVQLFQEQHGLAPTGVVDEQTATAINAEVDKLAAARTTAPAAVRVVPSTPSVATRPNPPPASTALASGPAGTPGPPALTRPPENPPAANTTPVEVKVVYAPSPITPGPPASMPPPTPPAPVSEFIVRGQVRHADGPAVSGMSVQAFDQDLRSRELLGNGVTDAAGKYLIRYSAQQFQRAEKNSADLVVQVSDSSGKVLVSSPVMFNAPSEALIDLVISGDQYRGPSEYEKLVEQIRPLLPGGVGLGDLVEDETHHDISFLAGETGEKSERIEFLAVANRFANKTALPAEVFYGLFRQGVPAELPLLLVQGPSVLRGALEASLKANVIPQTVESQIPDILNSLQQLIGPHVLRAGNENKTFAPLSGLLGAAGLSDNLQETFLQAFVQHEGLIEDFWKSMEGSPLKNKVGDVQLALQLGLLTDNNVPLVNAIKGVAMNLRSPRDLVRMSEQDWKNLIGSSNDIVSDIAPLDNAETREAKVERYATGILDTLTVTFPTAFLSASLEKDPEIDMALVSRVLASNPQLRPNEPLPDAIDWGTLNSGEQAQAKASLEALRQELNMFPGLKWNQVASPKLQNPLRKDVSRFLSNVPEFELRYDSIDRLISSRGDSVFTGVQDKEAVTLHLKRFQRVLRVAPRHDHMETLVSEGLDSARAMAGPPETSFLDQFASRLGGPEQTRAYHKNARRVTDTVTSITTTAYQSLNDILPFVINQSPQTPLKNVPDFTTLFGSYSLCECGECRSVYSPAAYFVDLMRFLDPKSGKKALAALRARRPDLEFIPLTCENTNTEMPYVDLVNEILEFYVAYGSLNKDAARDTVNITAEELSANPQYIIDAAYAKLQTEIYPPSLPFHRPLEVARLYLQHLGSSRYQVMKAFAKKGVPPDAATALEYLKISSAESQTLTGGSPLPLWTFYGYASDAKIGSETWQENVARVTEFLRRTGITYAELLHLLDTSFLNPNNIMTLTELGKDPQCDLSQTRINNLSDPILQKVHRFIRLAHKLGWAIPDLDITIWAMQANDITPGLLEKLAALAELKSEMNISLAPLLSLWADVVSTGADSLYSELFLNKAVLNPVDTDFDLSLLKNSTATLSDKSAVIMAALSIGSNDLSAIRAAAGLNDVAPTPGQSVAQPTISLANLSQLYRFVVLARVLKLKIVDFLSLRSLIGVDPFQAGHPAPTLEFVKKIIKFKQSGFSVAQLNYLFLPLSSSADPLAPREESTARLTQVLQDGLRNIIAETTVEPDPTGEILRLKLAMVLDATLIDKAMTVIEDPSSVPDSSAFIQQNFNTFLDPAIAVTALSDPSIQDPETMKQVNRAFVSAHLMEYLRDSLSRGFINQTLSADLKLDSAVVELLLETILKSKTDNDPAQHAMADFLALIGDGLTAVYYNDPTLSNPQPARIDLGINFDWSGGGSPDLKNIAPAAYSAKWSGKLLAPDKGDYTLYLRSGGGIRLKLDGQTQIDKWMEPTKITEYSVVVPMEPGTLHDIEIQFFKSSGKGIIEFRWSSASTPKEIVPQSQLYSSGNFSLDTPMACYRLLCKIALLINQFKITLKELTYLATHPGDFGDFDLNALAESAFPAKLFGQWERLLDLFTLRDSLPQGEVGLTDVFGAASRDEAIEQLKKASGWNSDEVDALASPGGFNLALTSDFSNEVNLVLMQECLALSSRLGASCMALFAWAKEEPTPAQARDIVNAAKAKYEPEQWLTVAKPLTDVLRGSQKSALIAHILASDTMAKLRITESNQLFEFFLIDVDMGTCMITSRIKQAISSVQLFIQRCLMNLEPNVSPSQIDAGQWEWMKNYRVWEANRKVFLYPENWMEPELRDDKSPFFRELETQLLQNDVTREAVEDAFLVYLKKLDEVAKLEVCGFYRQFDFDKDNQKQTDIVHAFARTPNPPHIYYYRQLNTGTWTPWEKVNVDIEGDHLIPIVYNRRLYIFWPHFEEKADENQQLDAPYIQSMEHSRWVQDQAIRKEQQDAYQQWQNEVAALQNQLDPLHLPPLLLNEQENVQNQLNDKKKNPPVTPPNGPPPAEPAYSTPPSLTHWEIKLAWSEYTQGKWTAKQVSSEFVESSSVKHSLEQFAADMGHKSDSDLSKFLTDYGTRETIAVIYLPELETHFFQATIDQDDLTIKVHRRYQHPYLVLGIGKSADLKIRGYEAIGQFRLSCGGKVKCVDSADSLAFESLPRPEDTANHFMTLQHEGNPESLTFSTDSKKQPILKTIPQTAGEYSLVPGHQYPSFALKPPFQQFFYQDKERAYYVSIGQGPSKPLIDAKKVAPAGNGIKLNFNLDLRFNNFFHPYACAFISNLSRNGIPGLLDLETQKNHEDTMMMGTTVDTMFRYLYDPSTDIVNPDYPLENVDFEHGAYALYNWELFFHIPMLIATSLSNNQQYEDAQTWFHYIFNPTTDVDPAKTPTPQRYWNTLPFFNNNHPEKERIQQLLDALDSTDKASQMLRDKVAQEIKEWRENPFDPYLIARMRISAFQKNVVMKYIDNLIAWGDQLFSRDTIESINEATLLYVLAHNILGPKPEVIPSHVLIAPQTYSQLSGKLDDFSNALVAFENQIPYTA